MNNSMQCADTILRARLPRKVGSSTQSSTALQTDKAQPVEV